MNYNYYIALDYAQAKTAIAVGTMDKRYDRVAETKSDIKSLKTFLTTLRGTKILTLEESTASHWLWVELRESVDEIIICDPVKNFLLTAGQKTDKIDALKLLDLLRGDLLTPVYHSNHQFLDYRKLMSTYNDIVKDGVKWKNRRSAILRAQGKSKKAKTISGEIENFTLDTVELSINYYENLRKLYHEKFKEFTKESKTLRALQSIPGIGLVNSMKIAATVVDPARFPTKGHFWAYCGLIKYQKNSGGNSYGYRNPRCCRELKSVFKSAVIATINPRTKSTMSQYYHHLIKNGVAAHNARNKVARKIATMTLSIMHTGQYYKAGRIKKCKIDSGN